MNAALSALCDTFFSHIEQPDDPEGYWARTAGDLDVPEKILGLIGGLKAEDRVQFEQLLQLLSSPLLGLSWLGPLKPFHRLRPDQRVALLHAWANSPLSPLRNAFNSLRKICSLLYFGLPGNPNYKTIGYQSFLEHLQPDPAPLPVVELSRDATLDCDVLVIGSGAGGSIVAAMLAAAGRQVVVVEKGMYSPIHQFNQQEFPMISRHFEAGGLLTSKDGSITVLAGSTMGGGTTINWAGALRTPDEVLDEWARQHGNPHFLENHYKEGFGWVEKRCSVGAQFEHNPQNRHLFDAAQALGWKVGPIPMNLRFPEHLSAGQAWKAVGYSCYGDAYGIKQGAAQTFLQDAAQHGAQLIPQVDIQKITLKNGAACGAEGLIHHPEHPDRPHRISIRAQQVVVACGALHTPVLLQKSGLTHPQIGQNLYLHPVAPIAALHRSEIVPWQGPMMSVVVQEFARLDGNWGVRLECPPVHPGLAAFALPWHDAATIKQDMLRARHLAVNFALVRDRKGGSVSVGKRSGQPIIHYRLSDYDRRHLLRGMEGCIRLHAAAGAESVIVPHNRPLRFDPVKENLDTFLARVHAASWGPNWFGLFSAHQMGTCRMGGSKEHPVQPNGETREVRGLFVADGSLFPSASGVNPMLSIQALAVHVGRAMGGKQY